MDNHMMQGSCKIIELETHKAFIKFLALRKKRKKKKDIMPYKVCCGSKSKSSKKTEKPSKERESYCNEHGKCCNKEDTRFFHVVKVFKWKECIETKSPFVASSFFFFFYTYIYFQI
jgi:hypothetical protein